LASLSSRRQAAGLQALKSATTFHNTNSQVNLLTGQRLQYNLGSITSGYEMQDMDETGCLFRALSDKSLLEKVKKYKGGT